MLWRGVWPQDKNSATIRVLAVCNRGSPLFVEVHIVYKKNSLHVYFNSATARTACHDAVLTYCCTSCNGTTAADNSAYPTHLLFAVSLLFADNTTKSNPTVTSHCTKGARLRVYWPRPPTTGRARPAHRMYLPSPARTDSQLVIYHLYLAPRLHILYELYASTHSTAECLICSESNMLELPHRVHSHHGMAGCAICSESHMSEVPHPCATKIKVRNHLKNRSHGGAMTRTITVCGRWMVQGCPSGGQAMPPGGDASRTELPL